MHILKKEDLKKLLNTWSLAFEVYAPTKNQGDIMLLPYEENELNLDYINFPFPIKEFLFKQKEELFHWNNNNGSIKTHTPEIFSENKSILFGVRPCDAYGVAYMDKFFLEGFNDELYQKNREATFIAAVNCLEVGEDCFCSSMGTGPFASVGYDILFTPLENEYLIEVVSVKGEELLALGEHLFTEADNKQLKEKQVIEGSVWKNLKQLLK